MSSGRFVAVLKPDRRLRQVLMMAGCASLLAGLALLMRWPVAPWARLGLAALWLLGSVWEISRLSRGAARVREIRLCCDGQWVVDGRGRVQPVQIVCGSVVLSRLAWLRVKWPDGLIGGELLRGDATMDPHWRHLQILWRQLPGSFGRTVEADTIPRPRTGSHY